jgi:hypothetical protein
LIVYAFGFEIKIDRSIDDDSMCNQHPNSKEGRKYDNTGNNNDTNRKRRRRERKRLYVWQKKDMMAFMPYENDVHIKHLLLCLPFLILKNILVIERFY